MIDEIVEIVKNSDVSLLAASLEKYHPYDIAEAIKELDDDDIKKLFSVLSSTTLADVLSYLDHEDSSEVLEDVKPEQVASVLQEMELDDASAIIDEMNYETKGDIAPFLPQDFKEQVRELNSYEEDTAGALMNPHFIKVLSGMSLKEAVKTVTKDAPSAESIDTIFVVDKEDHLLGTINLKDLITARMPKTVDDIMLSNYAYVESNANFDELTKVVQDYDEKSLAVLENGIIKGIITMDDAFDALTLTHEEDYARFAGMTEGIEKEETIFESVKKRIPWLLILLFLDLVIALVISIFDNVLEKITVLAFFQAAVLGLAGNSGTQTLAVSVRRIANGELDGKGKISKHLLREFSQGLGIGLILGILSFVMVLLLLTITNMTELSNIKVSLVVGISIVSSVLLSNFFGALLPVIFYKIHIDPAVASGPFITTLNDIISILIYFGIALIAFSYLF